MSQDVRLRCRKFREARRMFIDRGASARTGAGYEVLHDGHVVALVLDFALARRAFEPAAWTILSADGQRRIMWDLPTRRKALGIIAGRLSRGEKI